MHIKHLWFAFCTITTLARSPIMLGAMHKKTLPNRQLSANDKTAAFQLLTLKNQADQASKSFKKLEEHSNQIKQTVIQLFNNPTSSTAKNLFTILRREQDEEKKISHQILQTMSLVNQKQDAKNCIHLIQKAEAACKKAKKLLQESHALTPFKQDTFTELGKELKEAEQLAEKVMEQYLLLDDKTTEKAKNLLFTAYLYQSFMCCRAWHFNKRNHHELSQAQSLLMKLCKLDQDYPHYSSVPLVEEFLREIVIHLFEHTQAQERIKLRETIAEFDKNIRQLQDESFKKAYKIIFDEILFDELRKYYPATGCKDKHAKKLFTVL